MESGKTGLLVSRMSNLKPHIHRYVALLCAGLSFLSLWACCPEAARAADTGLKVTGTVVSAGSWTNFTTTFINTSNDQRAWVSGTNSYGVCSTYGFAIPAGAMIDGIEVKLEGREPTAIGSVTFGTSLSWDNGTTWSTEKTGSYNSTTDAVATLGGPSDTWARPWTDTELSDANFQLRVRKTAGLMNLEFDYITVRVYYQVPKTWDGGAGTNNWGDANNWNPDGVPISTDDVSLAGANTIDVNVAGVCNNLTLNNASLLLTVKSGNSLTVSGNFTVTTGTLNTEAAFPAVTGTTTLTAGTVGYTASSGSQTVAVQNYVNLVISGGGTKTLAGTITPSGNLSVNGGMFDLGSFTANRSSAGGTLTVANGATLKIGGTNIFPSNYNTHSISATSTVEYSGTTQSIATLNSSQNYGHLTVSGSATKTLAGTVGVAGDLTLSAGTLDLGSYTVNRTSAGGTLTVSAGATLKIGGTNTFPSNYTTSTLNATSTVEYNGTGAQTVAAQNYGHLTISGARTTNSVTLASSGTIGVAGTLTASATFTSGGYVNTGSTVNFNGSGAQSVNAITYYHLTMSGGSTKTAAGALAVNGDLTIGSSTTFAAGSYTHGVQGNWSNSGSFTAGTSEVQLTGSSGTAISGTNTFSTLTISKSTSSTTVTLSNSASVGTLNMTQGMLQTGANSVTITTDRTGSGIIIGTVTRTHTFAAGTSYAFEGPVTTVTFASSGTLPTSMTITTVLSSPGANQSMDPIPRYYNISQTGGSGFSYTLRLHYEDSEISAPNSETTPPLKLWHRTAVGPDVWERNGASASNTTANWVEASGQTAVGTWTLSSRTVPTMVLTIAQSSTNPKPGATVTYTISYSNTGDGSAGSASITASAPTYTVYDLNSVVLNGVPKTDAADADEVTVIGSAITINLGTVAAGGSGTVTYRVIVQ